MIPRKSRMKILSFAGDLKLFIEDDLMKREAAFSYWTVSMRKVHTCGSEPSVRVA